MISVVEHRGKSGITFLIEKLSLLSADNAKKIKDDLKYALYTHLEKAEDFLALEINEDEKLKGAVALLIKNSSLAIHLGEKHIAGLPIKAIQFLAGASSLNDDGKVYDALFSHMHSSLRHFNALLFYEVDLDSYLGKHLRSDKKLLKNYQVYFPRGSSTHYMVTLPDSGEAYLRSFDHNLRNNITSAIKQLKKQVANIELRKFSTTDEIADFLTIGESISKLTYQEMLLNKGLRKTESLEEKLKLLAQEGWFRSYVLFADNTPISFIYGHQLDGVYIPLTSGYDQKWRKYSPGMIILYLIVLDLIGDPSMRALDFTGGSSPYKKRLSNSNFQDADIFLMKKSFYCTMICGIHFSSRKLNLGIKNILSFLKIKEVVKKWMRKQT